MELTYDARWLDSAEARPLSLSLPMNLDGRPLRGERVAAYFDNLLPDSDTLRQRIRARFQTQSTGAFDLLEAIGRDCVGAVQLLPDGRAPEGVTRIDATRLDDAQIAALLRGSTSAPTPFDDDDDFRISLAGAQEKTALTWHRGRWCRPHAATPTTHIFKLPLGLIGGRRMDMRHSLENEWLCAKLLAGFGVPVADSEVRVFGDTRALVVTRFDRALHRSRKYWLRLPQEDLCQATATPSASKYEAEGGPGLSTIARILQGSESRDDDLATLLRAQLLFWMLAATDGHAKNFSLRLLPQARYQLTPLYDVISAWPIAGPHHDQIHPKKLRLAMSLGSPRKRYRLLDIERRHFNDLARRCGFGPDMEPILEDVIARTDAVIAAVARLLPTDFPPSLFDTITRGLANAARRLERMPPG